MFIQYVLCLTVLFTQHYLCQSYLWVIHLFNWEFDLSGIQLPPYILKSLCMSDTFWTFLCPWITFCWTKGRNILIMQSNISLFDVMSIIYVILLFLHFHPMCKLSLWREELLLYYILGFNRGNKNLYFKGMYYLLIYYHNCNYFHIWGL